MNSSISRRSLFKSASGMGAGLLLGSPRRLLAQQASEQKNFLLFIHLVGGYSASFSDPLSFVNSGFGGVGENNVLTLSNGVAVHNMFSIFPSNVLNMWATLGVVHGQSAHPAARQLGLMVSQRTSPLHQIAASLGGPSPNKFILSGDPLPQLDMGGQFAGVSMQRFTDMQAILDSLGGISGSFVPDRKMAADALKFSQTLSKPSLDSNLLAMESLTNAYTSSVETLSAPDQAFQVDELMADYQLTSTVVGKKDFASKLALAELVFRSSANVVLLTDRDVWDNHNDPQMQQVFARMRRDIRPSLQAFFRRVYGDVDNNIQPEPFFAGKNVTTVIFGDFVRRPDNSQHGFGVAASVIGPNVKNGNTANVRRNGLLANTATDTAAFWASLAAICGCPAETVNELVKKGNAASQEGFVRSLDAVLKTT